MSTIHSIDWEAIRKRLREKPGAISALARELNVRRQTVSAWFRGVNRIPAERVVEVERLTGINRSELRPDIWPPEETRAAS